MKREKGGVPVGIYSSSHHSQEPPDYTGFGVMGYTSFLRRLRREPGNLSAPQCFLFLFLFFSHVICRIVYEHL